MAPTNVKTVHQTSLFHMESNLDRLGLLSPTHSQPSQQQSGQITLQSVLIKPKFLKAPHHTEKKKNEIPRSMVVEALSWRSRRASQHLAIQRPVHPRKSPTNLARSPLLVGPRMELPWGPLAVCRQTLGSERHRYAIAGLDELGTDPMADGGINKWMPQRKSGGIP